MKANYLAIDFSTTNTGYAYKKNNRVVVGSISGGKAKTDISERTQNIINALIDMIEAEGLQDYFVAIEEPIITMKTANTMKLIRCNGMLLAALRHKFNMGFIDIPNVKWASYSLIKGKRKERKAASIEVLRQSGLVPEEQLNDDMADAYCILLYVMNSGKVSVV